MLNKLLTDGSKSEAPVLRELVVAGFIMSVGLCLSAMGTYLYQWRTNQAATLRYDGRTLLHCFGNLFMSFACGPYIVLQMGWQQERDGTLKLHMALMSAFLAFGWAFLTGLLFIGAYLAIIPR